jgi:hypothetical protein
VNLQKPTNLAQFTGLSERAVRKACAPIGPLAAARRGRGRIDIDHPAVRAWIEDHGGDPDAAAGPATPAPRAAGIAATLGATADDDLAGIEDMSLRAITDRYGSDLQFLGWTRARKELAQARIQEERLAKLRGQLIGRDAVELLFEALDMLVVRLARDAAVTIARDVRAANITRERAVAIAQSAMLGAAAVTKARMRMIVAGIDPHAPLRDPRRRAPQDPARAGALKALEDLRAPLREIAPELACAVGKDLARAVSGKDVELGAALEQVAGVEQEEAVRGVACRLDAAITAAVTRTVRPAMEIPAEPMSIAVGAQRRDGKRSKRRPRAARAKETT